LTEDFLSDRPEKAHMPTGSGPVSALALCLPKFGVEHHDPITSLQSPGFAFADEAIGW
jgi:hypothetical protein